MMQQHRPCFEVSRLCPLGMALCAALVLASCARKKPEPVAEAPKTEQPSTPEPPPPEPVSPEPVAPAQAAPAEETRTEATPAAEPAKAPAESTETPPTAEKADTATGSPAPAESKKKSGAPEGSPASAANSTGVTRDASGSPATGGGSRFKGMSPQEALKKAQTLQTSAERLEKSGQSGAAYAKAAEAYSLVQGHAADAGCLGCKKDLQGMLDRLASSANQKVGGNATSYRPKGKKVVIE